MKNVIFFTDTDWVFGRIHYDLIKKLFLRGFNCHLLPWNRVYSVDQMREFERKIDLFVTTSAGWASLKNYGVIPRDKCVIIAHSKIDIINLIDSHGIEEFEKVRKYACVSEHLTRLSTEMGIKRIPSLAYIGIDYNSFYYKTKDSMTTVGYGSVYSETENGPVPQLLELESTEGFKQTDTDLNARSKRGWLAKRAAVSAGLDFKIAQKYHRSFVTMPGFYRSIDVLINPSLEEGGGMPVLEAAAAGKLVITTASGYVKDRLKDAPIHIVSTDEENFLKETTKILLCYKNDNVKYKRKCEEIQEYAKLYDWRNCIDQWVELLS